MYGYHGEMRLTAPSRLRNEHFLEPVFDEENESDDGLYLRRPTTATSTTTPSRRHSPSGHSPSRIYSTLYEQHEPSTDEDKHIESAESRVPQALQTESSSASFVESTTSEAPTDLSKRSASTVSTAPTEGSVTDSRPNSQFKEQESQAEESASSKISPQREAAKLGIHVIQYEPNQPSPSFHVPVTV
jgi:hypothetical protein